MARVDATSRALGLAEKTILGVIAGAAGSIAVLELVFLAIHIATLATGPVTLTRVPTGEPLDAGFAGATFDAVDVTVDELTGAGRTALIGSAILGSLLTVGICLVLAWLCLRVFRGTPFVRSATWGIGAVSILVLLAGFGRPLLDGIAAGEAAAILGAAELPAFLLEFDPAPIAWGVALAVVAGAFEIGQRMQHDTRGLV